MWKIFFICLIVFMASACSDAKQRSVEANDRETEDLLTKNYLPISVDGEGNLLAEDLAAFAKKIEKVKILALGEQTHGAGSVFSLKTDLIKYLHQHHGFDLLILESGMYDVNEIIKKSKTGESINALAPGNIFYMYANSAEVTPLFDYVDNSANTAMPLTMVGFDSQHTGGLSLAGLVNDLNAAYQQNTSNKHSNPLSQNLLQQIQAVLEGNTSRFPIAAEQAYFIELNKVAEHFRLSGHGFWFRITQGLIAQSKRQWQLEDNRSKEMGENIKWWSEQYPDKKIIVWAHTWHLTKKGNNQVNAGQVVHSAFAEQYYVVHFTGKQGEYLSYLDLSNKLVAPLQKSAIEYKLGEVSSSKINYLENKALPLENSTMAVFANDYQQTLPAKEWTTYWDGMFILKDITPATYVQ